MGRQDWDPHWDRHARGSQSLEVIGAFALGFVVIAAVRAVRPDVLE
jgi:hypothetical protein